jgi:hypothetical protein
LLFDFPTIDTLASHLAAKLFGIPIAESSVVETSEETSDVIDDLLSDLDAMVLKSDEELLPHR